MRPARRDGGVSTDHSASDFNRASRTQKGRGVFGRAISRTSEAFRPDQFESSTQKIGRKPIRSPSERLAERYLDLIAPRGFLNRQAPSRHPLGRGFIQKPEEVNIKTARILRVAELQGALLF